jgi:hypothetical protein
MFYHKGNVFTQVDKANKITYSVDVRSMIERYKLKPRAYGRRTDNIIRSKPHRRHHHLMAKQGVFCELLHFDQAGTAEQGLST